MDICQYFVAFLSTTRLKIEADPLFLFLFYFIIYFIYLFIYLNKFLSDADEAFVCSS